MAVNPYAAPSADVNAEASGDAGSVEAALAGNYDFTIEEVLKDAWRLNDGFKLTFWGAAIVLGGGMLILAAIMGAVLGKTGVPGRVISQIASQAIAFVIGLGITMLAVRRAGGMSTSIGDAFAYFDRWLPAIIAGILVGIFTTVGFILLIVPGIYLTVAYHMTLPLIADRKMGSWDAMETSRKALSKKWLKMFLTGLVTICLTGLSGIFIIPLFWTIPWAILVTGVVYRRVFGVASTQ
jgi:hypothetical protein